MTRCATIPSFRRLRPSMLDRKSTRLTSSHVKISYAVFCLKKKKGVDVREMMAEIYGRRTGSCHGKGGSMHIADLSKGMLFVFDIAAAAELYTLSLHDALPI